MKAAFPCWWRAFDFEDGALDISLIGPLLCSLFTLLLSASLDAHASPAVLWVVHGAQAALLALSASSATAGTCARLAQWTQRVAPSRAGQLTRVRMWRQLRLTGGLGVCGPLVLVAVWQWQHAAGVAGGVSALLACLGLLAAAQLLGAWCGLAWRGRAPRWVLLGWLLLGVACTGIDVLWNGLATWPLAAVLGLAAVAWGWRRLAQRLQGARRSWRGVPRQRAAAESVRLRRPLGWQRLRFFDLPEPDPRTGVLRRGVGLTRGGEAIWVLLCVMTPQIVWQPKLWLLNSWGHAVQGMGVPAYGGWLAVLAMYGGLVQVHPGLHWRRQLAPGWRKAGWAGRMLAASVAALAAWLSLCVLLTTAVGNPAERAAQLATWPTVLGDAVFVATFIAWMRGLHNRHLWMLGCAVALGLVMYGVTAGLEALGMPLVRGGAWLCVQLGLAVPMAWAAVRAWARQDLSRLTWR